MCQLCEDLHEFDRTVDAVIAEQLPAMLSTTEDLDILMGN